MQGFLSNCSLRHPLHYFRLFSWIIHTVPMSPVTLHILLPEMSAIWFNFCCLPDTGSPSQQVTLASTHILYIEFQKYEQPIREANLTIKCTKSKVAESVTCTHLHHIHFKITHVVLLYPSLVVWSKYRTFGMVVDLSPCTPVYLLIKAVKPGIIIYQVITPSQSSSPTTSDSHCVLKEWQQ